MKQYVIILFLMHIILSNSIFAKTSIWADKIGGASYESISSIATDESDNLYTVGIFQTTNLYFNNGINLQKSTNNADVFLAKYNNSGQCQWADKIVGVSVNANEIVADEFGNIYIIGDWSFGNLLFNNNISLSSSTNKDVFLAKYDNNGVCQWAEKIAGNETDEGLDLVIHKSGNIYLTGVFNSPTISFNNGINLAQTKSNDIFLAKYDNNGICQWAEKIAGVSSDEKSVISVDELENIYIGASFFSDTVHFNNNILLKNGGSADILLARYDSSGSCQWAEKISGTSYDFINELDTDDFGNVYPIGYYGSTNLIFNNGVSLDKGGDGDVFFAKYNSNGQCQWANKIGGIYDDIGTNIVIDDTIIYVYGYYYSPNLIFNNGINLSNNVLYPDPFLAQYNSNGQCQWAERISGSREDYSTGLAVDGYGNIFVAGYFFSNTLQFNNGKNLTKSGNYDGFLSKYSIIVLDEFSIHLKVGWNLISSYIKPQLPDSMSSVMAEIEPNVLIVKNQIGKVLIPSYNINTIGRWDISQGYYVYMNTLDTLIIYGQEVSPSETPINLVAGWNSISYLRSSPINAEDAFVSITDNNNLLIAKTTEGQVYIPSYNINTIGNMQTGLGYKIYVLSDDELIYPDN